MRNLGILWWLILFAAATKSRAQEPVFDYQESLYFGIQMRIPENMEVSNPYYRNPFALTEIHRSVCCDPLKIYVFRYDTPDKTLAEMKNQGGSYNGIDPETWTLVFDDFHPSGDLRGFQRLVIYHAIEGTQTLESRIVFGWTQTASMGFVLVDTPQAFQGNVFLNSWEQNMMTLAWAQAHPPPPPPAPATATPSTPPVPPPPGPLDNTTASPAGSTPLPPPPPSTQIVLKCEATLEFAKIKKCWGWMTTHTYDLGAEQNIASVSGSVFAGPMEMKNKTYIWQIRTSKDGNTYAPAGSFEALGAQTKTFGPIAVNQKARFVQIAANANNGAIDSSEITITLAPPPVPPKDSPAKHRGRQQ